MRGVRDISSEQPMGINQAEDRNRAHDHQHAMGGHAHWDDEEKQESHAGVGEKISECGHEAEHAGGCTDDVMRKAISRELPGQDAVAPPRADPCGT